MKPGEIYWVDLATGRRPSIVVSREKPEPGNLCCDGPLYDEAFRHPFQAAELCAVPGG